MTTLPQTTRIQLPRPASGALAVSATPGAAAPGVTFAAVELHSDTGVLLASGRASQVIINLEVDPDRDRRGPAQLPSPSGGGQGGG